MTKEFFLETVVVAVYIVLIAAVISFILSWIHYFLVSAICAYTELTTLQICSLVFVGILTPICFMYIEKIKNER